MADCTRARYGTLADGSPIDAFTLRNASGMVARVLSYGGILQSLLVPDRDGRVSDVVLGFDDLESYVARSPYFGALIGRCANRIACGRFVLDGVAHQLATNDGPHHLHGGSRGFHHVVWRGEAFAAGDAAGVSLTYVSRDGEEGYPGTLGVRVVYTLGDDGRLELEYQATTDAPTLANLTHHSYFNLAGHDAGDVLEHELTITADAFTPVGAGLIPTGDMAPVARTPFDFRRARRIGDGLEARDEQLGGAGGYDHNWILRGAEAFGHAARLHHPRSGRVMDVLTTEPGLQFYSGNYLDGTLRGKGGHAYRRRAGLCLETQRFPDAPNHAHFPSVVLRPGETYRSRTVYAFGAS